MRFDPGASARRPPRCSPTIREPNADGRFNYQTPILNSSRSDSASTRLAYSINNRNQLQGTVGYQRTRGDSTTLFGFRGYE